MLFNRRHSSWHLYVLFCVRESFWLLSRGTQNSKKIKLHWKPSTRLNRALKKLQLLLQRNSHIKLERCVRLRILWSFHVSHVVQNRPSVLSPIFAWHKWFHVKAKNEKFTAAGSRCRQKLKNENFTSSFGRLRQNIAPKSVAHVQHDYFSLFNQSNHRFVTFSLPLLSSFHKLPNIWPQRQKEMHKGQRRSAVRGSAGFVRRRP